MPSLRLACAAVFMILLAACETPRSQAPSIDSDLAVAEAAKQKEFVVREELAAEARLQRVGYPLRAGGAALCGDRVRPSLGILAANRQVFDDDFQLAAAVLGDASRIVIVEVGEGSPAAEGGVRAGDILVSMNGAEVSRGEGALDAWGDAANELMERGATVALTVLRDGAEHKLLLKPRKVCDYPVLLVKEEAINAFADGEAIYVSKGLMRFAATDQELALVIAHELAHNAMGHIEAQQSNRMAGAFGGLLLDLLGAAAGVNTGATFAKAGAQSASGTYSVEFEQEADYVGLYLMARAGFPIDDAADYWRRMATLNPAMIELATTHPTTPERFLTIEAAVAEIKRKQATGLPLEPEMQAR